MTFLNEGDPVDELILARLKTAEQISEKVRMQPTDLIKLADAHAIPHYRVGSGGPPLFDFVPTRKWIAENLMRGIRGIEKLPINMRPVIACPPTGHIPTALSCIDTLLELPLLDRDIGSGVYFLCDGDEVIYVGQARKPHARLGYHDNKNFDKCFVVRVPVDQLNQVEGAFIRLLQPRLNGGERVTGNGKNLAAPGLSALDPAALQKYLKKEERRSHANR